MFKNPLILKRKHVWKGVRRHTSGSPVSGCIRPNHVERQLWVQLYESIWKVRSPVRAYFNCCQPTGFVSLDTTAVANHWRLWIFCISTWQLGVLHMQCWGVDPHFENKRDVAVRLTLETAGGFLFWWTRYITATQNRVSSPGRLVHNPEGCTL